MLQRIQTVYLLLVALLMVAVLLMPLGVLEGAGAAYLFDVTGVRTVGEPSELIYPVWALFALTAAIALLALVSIFLYKKRLLQIRLSVFNAILLVGFYALFGFFVYTFKQSVEVTFGVKIALGFPLIALVFDYLAIRNIGADEMLVRSLDRLRP